MFINARPRFVSNGFETLVPIQRVDLLYQQIADMTNNEVDAWSLLKPVAPSADHWDQHLDDFSNENFPLQAVYAGHHQDTASITLAHSTNLSKVTSYAGEHHNQYQLYKTSATSQQKYDDPGADMNSFEDPSLMLGNDYSQWSSFAQFSSMQHGLKSTPYETSNEADLTLFASPISLTRSQSQYQDTPTSGVDDILKVDRTSSTTVYSNYSLPSTSADPLSLACQVPNASEAPTKNTWWAEFSQNNKEQCQGIYRMAVSQDGLPRMHNHPQQLEWNDYWHIRGDSTNQITVSPRALALNIPSAPLSSCGSSQGGAFSLSDSNTSSSSGDDHSEFSGTEILSVVEPQKPIRRPRQILPDGISVSQRRVPVVPSNGIVASKSRKKRTLKTKSGTNNSEESNQIHLDTILNRKSISLWDGESAQQKVILPKRIEPKPADSSIPQPSPASSQPSQSAVMVEGMQYRDAKDDFLVRSKLAGMSYKDIRRQGNFVEAESTLRGRFRTLTKHKTARVRKPEWGENDIRLLQRAVRKLAHGSDLSRSKVPWKQVADYIANNGGSYHFGNATCRKRWDELKASLDLTSSMD